MTNRKDELKFIAYYFLALFLLFTADISYQVITNDCQPAIPFCTKQ